MASSKPIRVGLQLKDNVSVVFLKQGNKHGTNTKEHGRRYHKRGLNTNKTTNKTFYL